jgi:two-component SAPR family response regulator
MWVMITHVRVRPASESDGMSVDITLLGGFSVLVAGVPVPHHAWRRRAASAVVKLLALSEGHSLHREQVVDLLWPDLSPAGAMPRLHQAAHYARSALGLRHAVVLRRDRVTLLPDTEVRVDALEFRRGAEQALSERSAAAAEGVLADHGGELLPEDLYADWVAPHRENHGALRERLLHLTGRGPAPAPEEPSRPVLAGVGHHGRTRGLLLVIDDLAGADAASLRMLHHVAANITARGIGRVVELG